MPSTPVLTPPSPRRAVAAFLAAGLVALSGVGAVLGTVQHRSAVGEAVRDARALTRWQARDVVQPALTDAVLAGGPARDELDRLVRARVLGRQVVRVKIWDADGRIVYSDDRSLEGERFPLPEEEREALEPGGEPVAEVSDLDEAENRDEREFGTLLQVYLGVQTAEGTPLLFETYAPYDRVAAASRRMWATFLPVLIGGLALLWLAQAPLAWRLASRLRAGHDEREQLLVAALAASDRERQRLAADLHDGVVQGLSGASYTLSAQARRAGAHGDRDTAAALDALAVDLRRSVRELRSLVVTITPPRLRRQPLVISVRDLLAPLEDAGLQVASDLDGDLDGVLEQSVVDLVLRTLQEAVRNTLRHAGTARHVDVALRGVDERLELTVQDDGQGFAIPAGRPDSMGLSLLTGLAEQEGGRLDVQSEPGRGTVLRLVLPRAVPARVPA